MKLVLSREKARISKWLFVLYLIFILCFVLVIKDLYAFVKASEGAGFDYSFNLFKLLLSSLIVFIFIGLLTILKIKEFIYSVLLIILVFFVFPSAILFGNIENVDGRIFFSHCVYFSTILFLSFLPMRIYSQRLSVNTSRIILTSIVLLGIIPFIVLFTPYINLKNLLLIDVYETRAIMRSNINNFYTNYTYSWFNKFIIPLLLVFGLFFKNRITVIICLGALVFLYLCGANKAVFVGLLMVLVLYNYDYFRKMTFFLKFLVIISLASLTLSILGNDSLMVMAVRRPIFLPGLLDVLYFDFFDGNFLLWSESILASVIDYPYKYPHSYMVGKEYFGKIEWNANNGVISDGFMNFGMKGVLINSIVVGLYFSVLNQLDISPKFFGLIFLLIFLLISSSLTTILLTHGGLILLILAFFFMKDTAQLMK